MSRRDFLEHYAAAWSERAAMRRQRGGAADLNIAGALERIVASMRAELAGLPPDTPIAAETPDRVTWRSRVFNPGGRFNPFAGTYAEAMLATASLMEARGYADLAARCRERAASADPEVLQVGPPPTSPVHPRSTSRPSRAIWSGPNLPPPDPTPFVAGPQLEFFA